MYECRHCRTTWTDSYVHPDTTIITTCNDCNAADVSLAIRTIHDIQRHYDMPSSRESLAFVGMLLRNLHDRMEPRHA